MGSPLVFREASVLSHRRGNELQLEVLVLEDAVGSRATLGTTEWPVALTAAALGEFCKERQLQRSRHTSTKAVGVENVWGGWMWVGDPEYVRSGLHRRKNILVGIPVLHLQTSNVTVH